MTLHSLLSNTSITVHSVNELQHCYLMHVLSGKFGQAYYMVLQLVAETVRLLLSAISTASSSGNSDAEQSLIAVLLMLLIKDIAPHLTAAPALADIATKLVAHIASGPASAAFKAVVTALPTQDKLKLQVICAFTVLQFEV